MGSGIKRTVGGGLAAALMLAGLASAVPASAGAAAAYWYNGAAKVGASLGVEGASKFVMKANLNGTPINVFCTTSQEGTVSNNPVAGAGKLTAYGFGEVCGAELPKPAFENCVLSLKARNLPWLMSASYGEVAKTFSVALTGIQVELKFTTVIAVPVCPLNGKTMIAEGGLVGSWKNGAPSTLNFEEAEGITVFQEKAKVGTAKVTDSIPFEDEEEGAVTLSNK